MTEHEDAEAKRIGRLIAELRLGQGWSQQDLAGKLGKHISTISRWERGKHEGYAENVRNLAKALKVHPSLLRPTQPDIETQLERIESELTRQGAILDALAVALETELGDRVAAAAKLARQQVRGTRRAKGPRPQG